MKYLFTYILLLFTLSSFGARQDSIKINEDRSILEQKRFDSERLDNYRADKDFNYTVKKRNPSFLESLL